MALPLLAIHVTNAISLGSIIIGVLIGLAGLFVFAYGARWKAAYEAEHAAANSLKDGRDAFLLRSERLEDEKAQMLLELGECKGKISQLEAQLEAIPRYDEVVKLIGTTTDRMDEAAAARTSKALEVLVEAQERAEQRTIEAFQQHEDRAQSRHETEVAVAQEILSAVRKEKS